MDFVKRLAEEFSLKTQHVEHVIQLLDDGNTIPFIARYRKEMTGSLDDQVLREVADRLNYLRNLDQRRQEVYTLIEQMDKMTDEIAQALRNAATLSEVEDLYRPFRPKRRTRASIAREKGLEGLAQAIFAQEKGNKTPLELAVSYLDPQKGVETVQEAVQGAQDMIAEQISDDAGIRKRLRALSFAKGQIVSAAAVQEDSVYRLYYDFREPIARCASHRILAINRGEKEGYLKVSIEVPVEQAYEVLMRACVKGDSPCAACVRQAAEDAYNRLIAPSMEREVRAELTERADRSAIGVFRENLRHLLMQPPLRGKTVLALDPAYRTGCKVAVVDKTSKVLETGVIYPTPPHNQVEEAKQTLRGMIQRHQVEVLSIGNGTASRETERFAADLIAEMDCGLSYMVVSEAGASVYSASKLGAQEFPDYDVSVRSAVSIGRRLQDPLAELVKIDPKAIGVGQYQHDMPPKQLDQALTGVVEDCVNTVGVNLNTASAALLGYVSGVSGAVAKSIVAYREEMGGFTARTQLKKVPKLGPKAYEQCAGFLRVPESANVLDNTAVHPESYQAAEKLLGLCGYSTADVEQGRIGAIRTRVEEMGMDQCAQQCGVGLPTLTDMINELLKPGRDPRDELPPPLMRTDVMELKDLKAGMELEGTVRNVTDFGAFVDIGVHQDGLVHISQLADRFVRHPGEVVKTGDIVRVRVLDCDIEKKRISLTMRLH